MALAAEGQMRAGIHALCVVALACCEQSASALAEDNIAKIIGSHRYPLEVSGTRMQLAYESNWPTDRPAQFKKLVFYVHGSGHREVKHNESLRKALGVADQRDTLLFLPQFLKDKDRTFHRLPDDVLSWGAHWQWGDLSSGTH